MVDNKNHQNYYGGKYLNIKDEEFELMLLRMRVVCSILSIILIIKTLKAGMQLDYFYDAVNSFFFVYMGNGIFLQFTVMLMMFVIAFSFPFWLLSIQMVQYPHD